jgi:hypothetical protein
LTAKESSKIAVIRFVAGVRKKMHFFLRAKNRLRFLKKSLVGAERTVAYISALLGAIKIPAPASVANLRSRKIYL